MCDVGIGAMVGNLKSEQTPRISGGHIASMVNAPPIPLSHPAPPAAVAQSGGVTKV